MTVETIKVDVAVPNTDAAFAKIGRWFMAYIQQIGATLPDVTVSATKVADEKSDVETKGYLRGYQEAWYDLSDFTATVVNDMFKDYDPENDPEDPTPCSPDCGCHAPKDGPSFDDVNDAQARWYGFWVKDYISQFLPTYQANAPKPLDEFVRGYMAFFADFVEDSANAARKALQEGVVPTGGFPIPEKVAA